MCCCRLCDLSWRCLPAARWLLPSCLRLLGRRLLADLRRRWRRHRARCRHCRRVMSHSIAGRRRRHRSVLHRRLRRRWWRGRRRWRGYRCSPIACCRHCCLLGESSLRCRWRWRRYILRVHASPSLHTRLVTIIHEWWRLFKPYLVAGVRGAAAVALQRGKPLMELRCTGRRQCH